MVGKWHLCPDDEMNLASTRRNWPSGRGFERWYGFLGAETNQWYPDLVYDNHPVDQPRRRRRATTSPRTSPTRRIEFIKRREGGRAREAVLPVLRARRLPRAAPRPEGVDRQVQGPVRQGLRGDARGDAGPPEGARDRPGGHRAAADQPDRHARDPHGPGRQAVPAAGRHPAVGLAVGRREAAVRPDGRGVRRLPGPRRPPDRPAARLPRGDRQRENTLVVARVRQRRERRGRAERLGQRDEVRQRHPRRHRGRTWPMLDELGGPKTYNHYPNGWAMAFNTPFKMWKRYEFNGGTSDPCIISWPAGIEGARRDPRPVPPRDRPRADDPRRARRRAARDDQGPRPEPTSTASACATASTTPTAPTARKTQFYSMLGSRAIWHDGWKAVTTHPTIGGWSHFNDDNWELYHTDVDRSELHDLAAEQPGQGPRADEPVVRRGRRERRVPARRPFGARDHAAPRGRSLAPPREPLRLLPRRRRGAGVAGGQHPQPLVHDRRAGRHPGARRRGRAVRPRLAGSAGTPCTSRTTGCTTSTTSSACDEQQVVATEDVPTGEDLILSASFDKDGEDPPGVATGMLSPVPRRDEGRRGPDQDPARQVRDRRRGPVRRPRQRRRP